MNKYELPDDIITNWCSSDKVGTFDYLLSAQNIKNQISLTKNVFSFLIEGSKELVHHTEHTNIETSQFILIKTGKCLMTERLSLENHYRSLLLFFDDEIVYDFIRKNKFDLKQDFKKKPFYVFDYDPYIKNFVDSLVQLNGLEESLRKKVLITKVDEILFYLSHKHGTDFLAQFTTFYSDITNDFSAIIENNIYNNLSVSELAFLCNKSISAFKRDFSKLYNQSPIKWYQQKRLDHSRFLLEHKKLRPTDIFEQVGYESLSAFIQAYKKKYGITPKQHNT
jgi:AraC-like DNA-binding protein